MARLPAAAALAAALAALAGCTQVEVVESPLEFVRDDYEGEPCTAAAFGAAPVMDTYVLQAFAQPANGICCYGRDSSCPERRRVCLCGEAVPATVSALSPALAGARLVGLEPQAEYCLRVVALFTGHGRSGDARVCSCRDGWLEPDTLATAGRLCGDGASTGAPSRAAKLDVVCRDDLHRISRAPAFESCSEP